MDIPYNSSPERQTYVLSITADMRSAALDFACQIIKTNNQFLRLSPAEVRQSGNLSLQNQIAIQRTAIGKLGELVFAALLDRVGRPQNVTDMFTIYQGQNNVDSFDFLTRAGKTVDVKTGYLPFHKRLLVKTQQFDNIPKDIYAAVQLNARNSGNLVNYEGITQGTVMGYATYEELAAAEIRDFGEGPARHLFYDRLNSIDGLLSLM